jgi:hypothetical protein
MTISDIVSLVILSCMVVLAFRASGARRTFAVLVAIQVATAGLFMSGCRDDFLWLYQWGLFDLYLLFRLVVIPALLRSPCPQLPDGGRPIILLHPFYTGLAVSFLGGPLVEFIDAFKANHGLNFIE